MTQVTIQQFRSPKNRAGEAGHYIKFPTLTEGKTYFTYASPSFKGSPVPQIPKLELEWHRASPF